MYIKDAKFYTDDGDLVQNYLPPVDTADAYVNARLNGISLDEVRQIVREEIRAALEERD